MLSWKTSNHSVQISSNVFVMHSMVNATHSSNKSFTCICLWYFYTFLYTKQTQTFYISINICLQHIVNHITTYQLSKRTQYINEYVKYPRSKTIQACLMFMPENARKYKRNQPTISFRKSQNSTKTTFWVIGWNLYKQWRHNERGGVSNHQPQDCLLSRLFGHRSKKTAKLRVTGLCTGNSPVTGEFPAQMASNAENVSIWWRHCVYARSTAYFRWDTTLYYELVGHKT